MIVASFQEYLPLTDLAKIVAVCLAAALIAPAAASLMITGFEAQATTHRARKSRIGGDLRIALGVAILVVLIGAGLYALAFR
jgi:hypothetical protein